VELKGTVAIVTGGGTGIGRAICLALARAGAAAVVVNYARSAEAAAATVAELQAAGAEAVAVRADVTEEAAVAEMVSGAVDRWGRLDVLVNNAGATRFIPFTDLDAATDEVWDELIGINVKGSFRCTRLAAPHLRLSHGAVINLGSTAGLRGSGSSLPYAVSKAAVHHLTKTLAVALAPEVRVNAIAPGTVATNWYRGRFGNEKADEAEQRVRESTPLQGVASAEDCAAAALGLLASDWVTGQVLVVDGGKHLTY
jgi:NAD(P)-dependent dehydrogenase (short-subunit alcohol dehydrogenase family)